jgi:hypothetical protein
MSKNKVQFQKSVSFSDFMAQYGNKLSCGEY